MTAETRELLRSLIEGDRTTAAEARLLHDLLMGEDDPCPACQQARATCLVCRARRVGAV